MKKGFTLLELIIVIVVVGILVSLGVGTYGNVIENGRKAEARTSLGLLRKLQLAYYQEKGKYTHIDGLNAGLPIVELGIHNCNNDQYYFHYNCPTVIGQWIGRCNAYRCTSGGKEPQGPSYRLIMPIDGNLTEEAG